MEISLSLGEIFPPLRNCGSLAIASHLPFSFALRKSTSMTRPPPKWQNILPRPTFEHSENAAKIQHCLYPRRGERVIEGTLCMSPIWWLGLAKREESVVVNSQTVPYSHYILSIPFYILSILFYILSKKLYFVNIFLYIFVYCCICCRYQVLSLSS